MPPSGAHGKALHADGESRGVVGLDEHVHVVPLDRVLHDAKIVATGRTHRFAKLGVDSLAAKAW
jgi:hypothetical protein